VLKITQIAKAKTVTGNIVKQLQNETTLCGQCNIR
jgi:hypothetical protein